MSPSQIRGGLDRRPPPRYSDNEAYSLHFHAEAYHRQTRRKIEESTDIRLLDELIQRRIEEAKLQHPHIKAGDYTWQQIFMHATMSIMEVIVAVATEPTHTDHVVTTIHQFRLYSIIYVRYI